MAVLLADFGLNRPMAHEACRTARPASHGELHGSCLARETQCQDTIILHFEMVIQVHVCRRIQKGPPRSVVAPSTTTANRTSHSPVFCCCES